MPVRNEPHDMQGRINVARSMDGRERPVEILRDMVAAITLMVTGYQSMPFISFDGME